MNVPTFYFLKDNYVEDELEQVIHTLESCGAKVIIVQNGNLNNNLANDLVNVVGNHI